jgi:hypothetical protein
MNLSATRVNLTERHGEHDSPVGKTYGFSSRGESTRTSPMFIRLPEPHSPRGIVHQWIKGLSCRRVLGQYNPGADSRQVSPSFNLARPVAALACDSQLRSLVSTRRLCESQRCSVRGSRRLGLPWGPWGEGSRDRRFHQPARAASGVTCAPRRERTSLTNPSPDWLHSSPSPHGPPRERAVIIRGLRRMPEPLGLPSNHCFSAPDRLNIE